MPIDVHHLSELQIAIAQELKTQEKMTEDIVSAISECWELNEATNKLSHHLTSPQVTI